MSEAIKVLVKDAERKAYRAVTHLYDEEACHAFCDKRIFPQQVKTGAWRVASISREVWDALEKYRSPRSGCCRCDGILNRSEWEKEDNELRKPRKPGAEWFEAEGLLHRWPQWFPKKEEPQTLFVYGKERTVAEVRRRCAEYREALAAWEAEQ